MEAVAFEGAALFPMKKRIFYKWLNAVVFHEFTVSFASVTGSGNFLFGQFSVTLLKSLIERYKGKLIGGIGVKIKMGVKLIFRSGLYIAGGFELT
ncbi:MAG: hypothetical protein LBB73_06110, partial [Dysgonamonadaceae bacterium]|nr:hypothetical protein [Dysgonamonadaceae bacterium]